MYMLFKFKACDFFTPRYSFYDWPCRVYCERSGCLDLQIWSTWHLPGLSSMSQVRSYSWRVSRYNWRIFVSSGELTVRWTTVLSANNVVVVVVKVSSLCRLSNSSELTKFWCDYAFLITNQNKDKDKDR